MSFQMPLEMWTSMNREGSQNIFVFHAVPTADGSRDTCARKLRDEVQSLPHLEKEFYLQTEASSWLLLPVLIHPDCYENKK